MMETEGKKGKNTKTEYKYKDFGMRLDYVMSLRDISNQELACQMYVTPSTISGYRTGRRSPSVTELAFLATYLRVSADYLIGLQDFL